MKHPRFDTVLEDGRLQCTLCPRNCNLRDGQRGLCFVRKRVDDAIILESYGRSTGFCIDPIEKKPLNHFYPGTPVLSFGTAGCNLSCKFCQNHEISKSREVSAASAQASPRVIAKAAQNGGCVSVAFTYNDPVIFYEYALDTAQACRELNIKTVAVTAGYINSGPREGFFDAMDAANIDLKGFTPDFYKRLTGSEIGPVLDTIRYAVTEAKTWVELTTLLIPGENDSPEELEALSTWVVESCGAEVPIHFTAFHPDHRMMDRERTPQSTLLRARDIALAAGLNHVYVGNTHHKPGQSTYCPGCKGVVIGRDWHALSDWNIDDHGACITCGTSIAGRFLGPPGTWGRARKPVRLVS